MKAIVFVIACLLAAGASATERELPPGSASATVSISLTIPPRESSPATFRRCAARLEQRIVQEAMPGCGRNIEVALVTTIDDRRRRIEPI